jgi:hypothetical protein
VLLRAASCRLLRVKHGRKCNQVRQTAVRRAPDLHAACTSHRPGREGRRALLGVLSIGARSGRWNASPLTTLLTMKGARAESGSRTAASHGRGRSTTGAARGAGLVGWGARVPAAGGRQFRAVRMTPHDGHCAMSTAQRTAPSARRPSSPRWTTETRCIVAPRAPRDERRSGGPGGAHLPPDTDTFAPARVSCGSRGRDGGPVPGTPPVRARPTGRTVRAVRHGARGARVIACSAAAPARARQNMPAQREHATAGQRAEPGAHGRRRR